MSVNQVKAGNTVNTADSAKGNGGSGGGGSGAGSSAGSLKQFLQLHQHTSPQIIAGLAALYSTANMAADYSMRDSGDDSEDESEILEESPCGRWLKRREEVDQRDVPGVDCVHLAMDCEEGVEVAWNEVRYASLEELKSQEIIMRQHFNNIVQLKHENVIKFHCHWTETQNPERPRAIFITEYVSSGSLQQFLNRTKRNGKILPLESWRRWCIQILSALSYLHSCTPPIIHGHLSCGSIFIQHNGILKIGAVVADVVRVPKRKDIEKPTAADDVYAFGVCALEMGALEVENGFAAICSQNEEKILRVINNLDNELQRDFIFKCLRINPSDRPSAEQLLFHPLLFEVPSLKLLAAHTLNFSNYSLFSETYIDIMMQKYNRPDVIMAYMQWTTTVEKDVPQPRAQNSAAGGSTPEEQAEQQQQPPQPQQKQKIRKLAIKKYRLSDVPGADKLEKFMEDVSFGAFPLVAYGPKKAPPFRSRVNTPERMQSDSPELEDIEYRRLVSLMCSVKKVKEGSSDIHLKLLFRMDDKMNRQLTTNITENDTASELTQDLVRLGFLNVDDQDKVLALLEETLRSTFSEGGAAFDEFGAPERTFTGTVNEKTITNNPASNNNNSSNKNNNAIKTLETSSSTTSLNQMERNWSKADSDAAVATASLMLQTQNQAQQQKLTPASSSSMLPTAAAATALGLAGTATVPTVDSLAGHVMYVPHEEIQKQQQIQQQQQISQQHSPSQQQLHRHNDPTMVTADTVANNTTTSTSSTATTN